VGDEVELEAVPFGSERFNSIGGANGLSFACNELRLRDIGVAECRP
jgi:hypothetical protein